MKIRPIEDPAELPTVAEIPLGGVLVNVGNSLEYPTGTWRGQRPVFNADRCTSCLLCWITCPDGALEVEEAKLVGIDRAHCKGCGICAYVCPIEPKAIEMLAGGEYS